MTMPFCGRQSREQLPDRRCVRGCQFSEVGVCATSVMLSAFRFAVERVVSLCAKPQMARVYTWRIVAGMEYAQSWCDWSIRKDVRDAMGAAVSESKRASGNYSVTILDSATKPDPAFVWFGFARVLLHAFFDRSVEIQAKTARHNLFHDYAHCTRLQLRWVQ